MWGTNQWWQMPYGYQYQMPTQGSSEDWAAKAAMWAQQRRVQEQTEQYYSQAAMVQGYHGDPAQYQTQSYVEQHGYDAQHTSHQSAQKYPKDKQQATDAPPLPPEPEEEPTPPGLMPEEKIPDAADNMEMVAIEAEAQEAAAPTPPVEDMPGQGMAPTPDVPLNSFDLHHALPPQPEYAPSPPSVVHRETFDHHHGLNALPPTQPYSLPQQIDYGHQTASAIDYNHQRQGPVVFDYSRQYDAGYQQQLPSERYFPPVAPPAEQMPHADMPAAPSSVDYSGLSDVKKKGLPLWIREGLEKMEKQKKKQESQGTALNTSTSSLPSISGYKHSSTLSPAASPKKEESDEESDQERPGKGRNEEQSSDEDEEEEEKPTLRRGQHLFSRSQPKSPRERESSDDGDSKVDNVQREQNLVLNIRRLLTEILLTVTNDEITNIAQEAFDAAHKGSRHRLKPSGNASNLGSSGFLGLAGYGSDSESDDNAEETGNEDKNRRSRSYELDDGDDDDDRDHHSRKSRSQKHRDDYASDSSEEHSKSHRSGKRRKKDKRRRSRSRSESDRSSSSNERKKSRRSKHSRRERSRSSSPKRRSPSPKRRSKRSRRSRSRSRSPKKRKSSRKSRSRSRSSSESDSKSGSRHRKSKGDEKRKKRSSSRRSPASPGGKRDRRSRSRSRSSSPRRGRH